MSLDAGKLQHRVDIYERGEIIDSNGDRSYPWLAWKSGVPCHVHPLSGRELMNAQSMQSRVTARITFRYYSVSGLNAAMRILHRGKVYNIAGVLPDADSGLEYVTVPVSEGENDG